MKMKTAMKKKLTIAIVTLVGALVGCQSEVDKCTNALVKKFGQEKEAQARLICLEAQSGNK
jgi:hypothetical protein